MTSTGARILASPTCLFGLIGALLPSLPGAGAQMPGRCELPISERKQDVGCYVLESSSLGRLPGVEMFWHLYVLPGRTDTSAVNAPRSRIVEAFGKTWLFSIAPREWHSPVGQLISLIGPLPHSSVKSYTAGYLEAVIPPGEKTLVLDSSRYLFMARKLSTWGVPFDTTTAASAGSLACRKIVLPPVVSCVGTSPRP